jgi:nitrous oxidase accessory protein NosD
MQNDAASKAMFAVCAIGVLAIAVFFVAPLAAAKAEVITVQQPQELAVAVAKAQSGDVIELTGEGPFAVSIVEKQFSPPLLIRAQNSHHSVAITSISISGSSGIEIANFIIDHRKFGGRDAQKTISVIKSSDVTLSLCDVSGSGKAYLTKSNQPTERGEGLMIVRWSKDFEVRNCRFSGFFQGMALLESTDIKISHNDISRFQGDGIRMAGVQRVEISDNRFHDFLGSDQAVNHSDMIQLWSTHAKLVSSDISILRNRFLSGDGPATQSIFMRNEQADHAKGATERFYERISVKDNLIHNGHTHGILVGETNGVDIRNNTLIQNESSTMGNGEKRISMAPTIKVAKASTEVTVVDNMATRILAPGVDGIMHNYILSKDRVSRENELKQFFASETFSGKLKDENYQMRPGTIVYQRKLGSSMTY